MHADVTNNKMLGITVDREGMQLNCHFMPTFVGKAHCQVKFYTSADQARQTFTSVDIGTANTTVAINFSSAVFEPTIAYFFEVTLVNRSSDTLQVKLLGKLEPSLTTMTSKNVISY